MGGSIKSTGGSAGRLAGRLIHYLDLAGLVRSNTHHIPDPPIHNTTHTALLIGGASGGPTSTTTNTTTGPSSSSSSSSLLVTTATAGKGGGKGGRRQLAAYTRIGYGDIAKELRALAAAYPGFVEVGGWGVW